VPPVVADNPPVFGILKASVLTGNATGAVPGFKLEAWGLTASRRALLLPAVVETAMLHDISVCGVAMIENVATNLVASTTITDTEGPILRFPLVGVIEMTVPPARKFVPVNVIEFCPGAPGMTLGLIESKDGGNT
jgi:hypothetical protein